MVKRVQDDFGKLDILVNNAGIQFVAPVQDFPEVGWAEGDGWGGGGRVGSQYVAPVQEFPEVG